MAIAFDCLLPIPPELTATERLTRLTRLKNALIGHSQRKLITLRSGELESLVLILQDQPGASTEEAFSLCTQTASILGALSSPTPEAVSILLSARAHSTLIVTFTRLMNPKLPSVLPLAQQHKLAETLLRAIKTLYVDLTRVIGPRAWGTDVIGGMVSSGERKDVRLQWQEQAGWKGKGRDEGLDLSDGMGKANLQIMADRALEELFQTQEVYGTTFSPSTSQPGVLSSGQRRPSGILAMLLQLLVESSYLQDIPSSEVMYHLTAAMRTKMADLICTLLAGTVRLTAHRLAILGGEGAPLILSAIHRLIVTGSGKVQKAALNALAALARDFRRLLLIMGTMEPPPHLMTSLISDLCNSTLPSLALAAATCRTVLYKTMRSVQYSTCRHEEVEPLIPILLSLIENEPALRAQANFTLTYLISDSEELQRTAVKLNVLNILRSVLSTPPTLQQPYATPSSVEEISRTAEGALLTLAVLCSKSESHRHDIISASLLPLIVASLSSPSAGVRAAACHCIRGLGRSVNVLRTSLLDTGAAKSLWELLREEEDIVVQITAAATVSNLVLEFSPMRQVLIDQGCIQRMCELVKSTDSTLQVNALWALKNASYQSSSTFKRAMMKQLGWSFLAELIEASNEEITRQALSILRNITCTHGNDPVTGLSDAEIGENRMLTLLEACATSTRDGIVIGALYTIVNLATANETCRLAVASRTALLRSIVVHLHHADPETRTAAVWCIINLCHTDRSSFHARARRPREILDKLRAMGVDEELRRMSEDESLDVRERVRDALEVLSVATIKKAIAPVPTAADFIDIILSSTQRRTPTVIHNGFKITRIRSFYMRKIKFAQQAFEERLDKILSDFPIMDNLHPFLSSLLNVLYDKNHYKLALGQLNTARHLIVSVGKDYCRLVKFGDSLFRCKQLKKAALGRMATIMRRQKDPLAYLEEVRQHMSRLPTIDPTTRTLLICGYPNVGKSSFVNKVTRADVDVQPYAFTTKSLFVGHMDYKYLRWQVIDTPGVLDHPLEEMNTIEMQSITALAHLRSCVLYFMDLSEQCGYTVEAQCKLYQSIKPLFTNKPTFIVCNKIDVMRRSELDPARKAMVDAILNEDGVTLLETSTVTDEGVMDVRNTACDALLAHRVESKEKTKRVENVANRVRVSVPVARDGVKREPFIPAGVATRKAYDKADPERRRLERDEEEENGGAGAFSVDMKKNYLLKNDEWKYDVIPEIQNGKNVADFIDPDIVARLEELEAEEERLEAAGFYDDDSEEDSDEEAIRTAASAIRDKKANIRMINHQKNKLQNRPVIPRTVQTRTLSDMTSKLAEAGYDPSNLEERARVLAKARGLTGKMGKRSAGEMEVDDEEGEGGWADEDSMDVEEGEGSRKKQKTSTSIVPKGKRVPGKDRQVAGLGSAEEAAKAIRLRELYQRGPNMLAKASESDRHIRTKMPKHLFSGKRKAGKTNRR